MIIAVTGASGWVGGAVVEELRRCRMRVRPLVRSGGPRDAVTVGNIGPQTDWADALFGVTTVIHVAARVHVMKEKATGCLAAFREVNVAGTRRLAEQAAALGVRRIVFVSSVKVNGERTEPNRRFSEQDQPAPEDAYGISKWEAEQALTDVAARTGLEVVIVRPPLVYGPEVKGNFARLVRWVEAGVPLPFASVQNRRSLVSIDNLVDLLGRCAVHPHATGQIFLAGDGEDFSTPDLVRKIARAMGRSVRLVAIPPECLRFAARLVGRGAEIDRLVGSLQVDISHTCATLDWRPPLRMEEALKKTVALPHNRNA